MDKQEKYKSLFAARLRKLLDERGTTITALSKVLGISRQAVSQYADGTGQPNVDKLRMISNYFGVSSDYIIGLSDTPTRNETIQGINKETGLWGDAIAVLRTERFCGDDEISDFVSFLIENEDFLKLIRAVKQKNNYSDSSICSLDIEGEDQTIIMGSLWKVIITDLFWEITKGYTAKPGEIMVGYKVGKDNG